LLIRNNTAQNIKIKKRNKSLLKQVTKFGVPVDWCGRFGSYEKLRSSVYCKIRTTKFLIKVLNTI